MTSSNTGKRDIMRQIISQSPEIRHTTLAKELNVSEKTIRRWREETVLAAEVAEFTRMHTVNLDTPLDVGPQRTQFSGDMHIPLTSYEMTQKMAELALDNGITDLLINGDGVNADALSVYEPKQTDHTLNDEVKMLKAAVWSFLGIYERIWWCLGNHDVRWLARLGFKMTFSEALGMILGDEIMRTGRVQISNLDFIFAGPENNKWYVCHPKAYSRQPLVGTRRMAYKVGMNVATGHSHHFAIGSSDDGQHVCVESGGIFDHKAAAYLQASTGFPVQTQGLCWIDETGRAHPWSPAWG